MNLTEQNLPSPQLQPQQPTRSPPHVIGRLLYLFGMPLALDWYSDLRVFVTKLPAFIWRLLDEEKMYEPALER
jgi:hypothetical protein